MADIYIPWTTARYIISEIDSDHFIPAVKWIKNSRGLDLRCAKFIADALRDGDFEMEDYLDGRYVCLSVEVSRLTIA